MLQSWLQDLDDDYAVKDLINEVKDWIEEGYVESTIWKRLQNCVAPGLLPTFSERRSTNKRSGSSSPTDLSAADDKSPPACADVPQTSTSTNTNTSLINELKKLREEGHLDETIWKRLDVLAADDKASLTPDVPQTPPDTEQRIRDTGIHRPGGKMTLKCNQFQVFPKVDHFANIGMLISGKTGKGSFVVS